MEITAEMVRNLRDQTGAGIMDCKNALKETDGDVEKAVKKLREKGLADAEKKAGRSAAEGLVEAYIHFDGKLGVMAEINCETDFVAKTDKFKSFCKDICMHIAAASPKYVTSEEVPQQELEEEKEIYKEQMRKEGKPEQILEKIAQGKIKKYYSKVCLMEQQYVKEPDRTITDIVKDTIANVGENIIIKRFVRFKVGEQ